jgi:GTP-binding protein
MIVGIHSRDNDLVVNATRTKQLTNFRVSGKEDAIKITPPIDLTLEYAVEFIDDDELVEITPKSHPRAQAPPEGTRAQARRARVARPCGFPGCAGVACSPSSWWPSPSPPWPTCW